MSDALITFTTELAVVEVMDKLEKILNEKNITVFARISHSDAAKKYGLSMQDEELIIFGNPTVGTPLMIEQPEIGIELPLKIIAWKDKTNTKIAFQNLKKIASDYSLKNSDDVILSMNKLLENLVHAIK